MNIQTNRKESTEIENRIQAMILQALTADCDGPNSHEESLSKLTPFTETFNQRDTRVSPARQEGIFDVQRACDKLKLTRSNRLHQRDFKMVQKPGTGRTFIDNSVSLGPSSTVDITQKTSMRYLPQTLVSSKRLQRLKTSVERGSKRRDNLLSNKRHSENRGSNVGTSDVKIGVPVGMAHDKARQARPMTAAHARAMGGHYSGFCRMAGTETAKNLTNHQREMRSLNSTQQSWTGGLPSVEEHLKFD